MEYTDPNFRERFARLFTLNQLLRYGIVESGYIPPDTFGQAVSLTPTGQEVLSVVQSLNNDYKATEIKLALFIKFFHHELFVDVYTTEVDAIQDALHEEITIGNVRYPWVYDRCLYDRFFEMFPTRTKFLTNAEVMRLLENTPQGVFQVRNTIVGPFGILNSTCYRDLPPTTTAPLWHCSDPSCSAMHPVRLNTGDTRISKVCQEISELHKQKHGPPSEWSLFFLDCGDITRWYDDCHPGNFPWLLANAFSEIELQSVVSALLKTHSDTIRQAIPKTRKIQNIFRDSPEKVAAKLTSTVLSASFGGT